MITVKVNDSTIINNVTWPTVYTKTAVPINSENNVFEFLCYNTGGSAVFAAYVVSTNNSTYLFSTDSTKIGWSVDISGFFSNGYPVSSLLTNESGLAKTNIGTTFFKSQNIDLSNNQCNRQVPTPNLFFRTNNTDFKDQFFNYV
jgi:bacteriorhodopsin